MTVQSHIEDQLATMLRPVFNRGAELFRTHDDLIVPLEPLVAFFADSAKKALEARQNNKKVADAAVAKAAAKEKPEAAGTPASPGIVVPPGTVVTPGTVVQPRPVKTPPTPPAPKRRRGRG